MQPTSHVELCDQFIVVQPYHIRLGNLVPSSTCVLAFVSVKNIEWDGVAKAIVIMAAAALEKFTSLLNVCLALSLHFSISYTISAQTCSLKATKTAVVTLCFIDRASKTSDEEAAELGHVGPSFRRWASLLWQM